MDRFSYISLFILIITTHAFANQFTASQSHDEQTTNRIYDEEGNDLTYLMYDDGEETLTAGKRGNRCHPYRPCAVGENCNGCSCVQMWHIAICLPGDAFENTPVKMTGSA